jgi:tetratricopeptide (TPR) repeat protein
MRNLLDISPEEYSKNLLNKYEELTSNNSVKYFDVDDLETIIDYYLYRGRYAESSKAINLGLRLHPDSTELKSRKARLYMLTGKLKSALKIIEDVNVIDKFDDDNLLLQGEILVRLSRIEEAEIIFDQLLIESETEPKDDLCLDIAYIFIYQSLFDYSLKYLEIGYNINSENIIILFELAFSHKQKGNTDKAIEAYSMITEFEPFLSDIWFDLGQLFFSKENYEKAIEAYDFATAIDEYDFMSWMQKGHAYFHIESYLKAIDAYYVCLDCADFNDQPFIYIGECYEQLEDFDKAIEFYKFAIRSDEKNIDGYIGIAICLIEKGCFKESLKYSRKALKFAPQNSEPWIYIAEAYVNLEDPDKAIIAYKKALKIDERQPDTLLAIGNLYLDKEKYKKSLEFLLKAFAIEKDTEGLTFFLAVNYYKLKQYDLALFYLKDAASKEPKSIELFLEICPEAKDITF